MSEWDQRQLCGDGACVGVIGPDGTCKTCGRVAPNWGDERNRGLTPLPPEAPSDDLPAVAPDDDEDDEDDDLDDDDEDDGDDDEDDEDDDGDEEDDDGQIHAVDPELLDGDWRTRKLCPDGACVGVIGADGTCKACGKIGV